jgi:hypothetical protein
MTAYSTKNASTKKPSGAPRSKMSAPRLQIIGFMENQRRRLERAGRVMICAEGGELGFSCSASLQTIRNLALVGFPPSSLITSSMLDMMRARSSSRASMRFEMAAMCRSMSVLVFLDLRRMAMVLPVIAASVKSRESDLLENLATVLPQAQTADGFSNREISALASRGAV